MPLNTRPMRSKGMERNKIRMGRKGNERNYKSGILKHLQEYQEMVALINMPSFDILGIKVNMP